MPEMIPVSSSNIAAYSYDAALQDLTIEFNTGGTFRYIGVPQDVVDAFLAADSLGGYFARNIKNAYPYSRISY